MVIVKSVETPDKKIWIEQHNDFFIFKYQERNKEVMCLTATQNLSLVLEFFDKMLGKDLISN